MKNFYNKQSLMEGQKILAKFTKLFSFLIAIILFSASNINAAAACSHTFVMNDSYGDGWNGTMVEIFVNGMPASDQGLPLLPQTLSQGSSGIFTFDAGDGDLIEMMWSGGSWHSEISWQVLDGNSAITGSGTHGDFFAGTGACPSGGGGGGGGCVGSLPQTEDFSSNGSSAPSGWTASQTSGSGWVFSGNPGWHAANNGRTAGTYAWIDFSGTDIGIKFESPEWCTGGANTAYLTFSYFSDRGTINSLTTANIMYIEQYNGSSWSQVAAIQEFNTGWVIKGSYAISSYINSSSETVVKFRFRAESGGHTYDYANDLLIDDIALTTTAAAQAGLWTGASSTLWNDVGNWDDGNVPDNTVAVTIPTSANYTYEPFVNIPTAQCASLTIEDGGALNFGTSSGNLDVSGNFNLQNGGKIEITAGTLTCLGTFDWDGSLTMSGSNSILDVNGGIDLSATSTEAISGGTIFCAGNWNAQYAIAFTPTGGTVVFDPTSEVYIMTSGYTNSTDNYFNDVTISGDVYQASAVRVKGDIDFNSTFDWDMNGVYLFLEGDLNTNGTGTSSYNASNGKFHSVGTSYLYLEGSANQSLGSFEEYQANVILNKTGGTVTANGYIYCNYLYVGPNSSSTQTGKLLIDDETIRLYYNCYLYSGTLQITGGMLRLITNSSSAVNLYAGATADIDGGEWRIGDASADYWSDVNMLGGTLDISGGTVNICDELDVSATSTNTVTISGGTLNIGTYSGTSNGSSADRFEMDGGTLNLSGGTINIKGQNSSTSYDALDLATSVTVNASANNTINIMGGAGSSDENMYIDINGAELGNVTINLSGYTATAEDAWDLAGDLTISNGTLNKGSYDLDLEGSFSNSGTFTTTGGTITFDGSGDVTCDAISNAATDIYVSKTSSGKVTTTGNLSSNDLYVTAGTLLVDGETVAADNDIEVSGGTLQLTSGLVQNTSNNENAVTMSSGSIEVSGGELRVGDLAADNNADLYMSGGTYTQSGGTVNVCDQFSSTTNTVTITSGNLNTGAYTGTSNGGTGAKFYKTGGTLNLTAGTITVKSQYNSANNNALQINSGVTVNATVNNTIVLEGQGENMYMDLNSKILGNMTIDHSGYTVYAEDAFTLLGDLTVTSGTLACTGGAADITLNGGSFINNGTFNLSTADLNFTGGNNVTCGAITSSYGGNLKITKSSSSNTVTTTGDLNLNGITMNEGVLVIDGETVAYDYTSYIYQGATIKLTSGLLNYVGSSSSTLRPQGGTLDIDGGELRHGTLTNAQGYPDIYVAGGYSTTVIDISGGTVNIEDELEMNSGTLTLSGGTLNINAHTGTAGGSSDAKFYMGSSATLNLTGGALNIYGQNPSSSVNYSAIQFAAGMTANITSGCAVSCLLGQGSNDENMYLDLNGVDLDNLTVNTPGYEVVNRDNTSIATLTVSAGTFDVGTSTVTASGATDINGTLQIGTGEFNADGTFDATGGTIDFTGAGDLKVATASPIFGTLDASLGTVTFDGSSAQYVNNNTTFNDLTIDNSAGVELVANSDVSGTLTFSGAGDMVTSSTYMLTINDGGSVSGADDDSHVKGPTAMVTTSTNTYEFPVGDGTKYRPVFVTPASSSTTTFTGEYFDSPHSSITYDYNGNNTTSCGSGVNHVSGAMWWDVDRTAGSANAYVAFNWDGTMGVDVPSEMLIAHWNGTEWETMGGVMTGSNGSGSATPSDGRVKSSVPWTSFSPGVPATSGLNNPLPIDLLSFTADCSHDIVDINFSVTSQVNNDYFIIEKSKDAMEWEEIGRIEGAGNTNSQMDYNFVDGAADHGLSYYRLTQVDYDGTTKSYAPRSTSCESIGGIGLPVEVYPNPMINEVTIEIDLEEYQGKDVYYTILDAKGAIVLRGDIELNRGFNKHLIDVQNLPNGVYLLRFNNTRDHISETRIVKR